MEPTAQLDFEEREAFLAEQALLRRVQEHPEVAAFLAAFPDAQIRKVKELP